MCHSSPSTRLFSSRRRGLHTHTHTRRLLRWHTRAALPTPTRTSTIFFFCTIPTYLQYIFRVVLALVAVVADLAICCFCFTTYADNCHAVCSALWISRAQVKQTIKINRKKECKKKEENFYFYMGGTANSFMIIIIVIALPAVLTPPR